MQVLVTGAAGFIGSHLSEALLRRGDRVVGLDAFIDYYPASVKRANLEVAVADPGFRLVEEDLRTGDLDAVVEGCDAVVHAAAMPGLPRSWTDFELYSSCNISGTQRLAEAARGAGVSKFVHISTSSVYGLDALGDETMPVRPVSPYGVTKLAAENLLWAFHEMFDLPVSVVRFFSVYGPRQRPDMAWHKFIDAIAADRTIQVFGDGEQSRSSTYVDDAVQGTIGALDRAEVGETYNIGGGEVVTVLEAIDLIGRALGRTPRLEYGPVRPGDQRATRADTTKAQAHFGYEALVGPREGFARQIAWQTGTDVPTPS
ncbi:MAG: NAD-dependent epimerase/dehydratase family protein [Nocardioidaceae bacterium]